MFISRRVYLQRLNRLDVQSGVWRHLMGVYLNIYCENLFSNSHFCFIYFPQGLGILLISPSQCCICRFFLLIAPFALCQTLQTFHLHKHTWIQSEFDWHILSGENKSSLLKCIFIFYIVNMHRQRETSRHWRIGWSQTDNHWFFYWLPTKPCDVL